MAAVTAASARVKTAKTLSPSPRLFTTTPAMTLDACRHQGIVAGHRTPHRIRMALPDARAPLNVGEEEGDDP